MKYFSLTITLNERDVNSQLQAQQALINELLDELHEDHCETGYIGWECQTREPHCLHIHTLLASAKQPYFKRPKYSNIIKKNKLNVMCNVLQTAKDVDNWVIYCHKEEKIPITERYNISTEPSERSAELAA